MTNDIEEPSGSTLILRSLDGKIMKGMIAFFLLALSTLVFKFWDELGPHRPSVNSERKLAAEKAAQEIVTEIQNLKKNFSHIKSVSVSRFSGDPTDAVYNQTRWEIESRNIFQLKEQSFLEKICIFLNMDHPKVSGQNEAATVGEVDESDSVLFADILEFEHFDTGTVLKFECSLLDVKNKKIIYHRVYSDPKEQVPQDSTVQNETAEAVKPTGPVPEVKRDENQKPEDTITATNNNSKVTEPAVAPESSCPAITASAANTGTGSNASSNFFFRFPRLKMLIGAFLFVVLLPLFTAPLIAGVLKVKSNLFSFGLFMLYNLIGWGVVKFLTESNLSEYRSLLLFIVFCLLIYVFNFIAFSLISKSTRKNS